MSNDREEEQKVKVKDRRRFVMDASGEVIGRPDAEVRAREEADLSSPQRQQAPAQQGVREQPSGPAPQVKPAGGDQAPPESQEDKVASQIFLEFLNNLAHSLLVHLGELPDPGSGLVRENLEAAQQTLEILGVLRKKTHGNLSAHESRIFDSLIYELMMRFRQKVESARAPAMPQGRKPG